MFEEMGNIRCRVRWCLTCRYMYVNSPIVTRVADSSRCLRHEASTSLQVPLHSPLDHPGFLFETTSGRAHQLLVRLFGDCSTRTTKLWPRIWQII